MLPWRCLLCRKNQKNACRKCAKVFLLATVSPLGPSSALKGPGRWHCTPLSRTGAGQRPLHPVCFTAEPARTLVSVLKTLLPPPDLLSPPAHSHPLLQWQHKMRKAREAGAPRPGRQRQGRSVSHPPSFKQHLNWQNKKATTEQERFSFQQSSCLWLWNLKRKARNALQSSKSPSGSVPGFHFAQKNVETLTEGNNPGAGSKVLPWPPQGGVLFQGTSVN